MIEWLKKFARTILLDELNNYKSHIKTLIKDLNSQDLKLMKLDEKIMFLNEKIKTSKFKHSISTVKELYDDEDLRRTQSDKPSAHSSLTFEEAHEIVEKAFPEPNYRVFSVSNTNSMEPFIDQNSLVITEKIRFSILKDQPLVVGDICIYDATIRGQYTKVIHRIIKVNEEEELYYFLGDNNYGGDGWIPKQNIKYRYLGQVQTRQILKGD